MPSTNLDIIITAQDRASKKLTRLGNTASKTAGVALKGLAAAGIAVAGGLALAVKEASNFEDAMVEVQKVTDPKTAEQMSESIREMAKEMPLARDELAGLAADAARFGIEGVENLKSFTTTVAKMSVATDLSSQEAGTALAKLATLTKIPTKEVGNLGSAINELSNNAATSSKEIVDSMLRSSAGMHNFGLSAEEMVAVSGALNEVSESSQRAGTRLRRLFQELDDPKKIEDIASAMGLTVDEFKEIRERAPIKVIQKLLKTMKEGGKGADKLKISLSTVSRQAIAALTSNTEGLNEALETSADSYKKNTSLSREFEAASNTLSAKWKIFKNNISDVAVETGEKLLPVLSDLLAWAAEKIPPAFNTLKDKFNEVKDAIVEFFTENEIGIGIMETIEQIIETAIETWEEMKKVYENNKEEIKLLAKIVGAVLMVGILLLVGAVLVLVKAFKWTIKAVGWVIEKFKIGQRVISGFFKGIKIGYKIVKRWIGKIWDKIKNFVSNLGDKFSGIKDIIAKPFNDAWDSIKWGWNNTIGKLKINIPDWVPGVGGRSWGMPKLAQGGFATMNRPYIVGEQGPELFVPSQSGNVVPNSKMGGGVTVNIYGNINNKEGLTPNRIASMIGREIELAQQGA